MYKSISITLLIVIITSISINLFADFPVKYEKHLDLNIAPVVFALPNGNKITLTINPETPKPLHPFTINALLKSYNDIRNIQFATNMNMNMGRYIFNMKANQNLFSQVLTLPKCGSGNSRWYAKININFVDGTTITKFIFFDVK